MLSVDLSWSGLWKEVFAPAWGQWDGLGMPDQGAASFGSLRSCSEGSQGDGTVSHRHPCVLGRKKERKNKTHKWSYRTKHPDCFLFVCGILISLMIYTASEMSFHCYMSLPK